MKKEIETLFFSAKQLPGIYIEDHTLNLPEPVLEWFLPAKD